MPGLEELLSHVSDAESDPTATASVTSFWSKYRNLEETEKIEKHIMEEKHMEDLHDHYHIYLTGCHPFRPGILDVFNGGFAATNCLYQIQSARKSVWIQDVCLSGFDLEIILPSLALQSDRIDVRILLAETQGPFGKIHPNPSRAAERTENIIARMGKLVSHIRIHDSPLYSSIVVIDEDEFFWIPFLEQVSSAECPGYHGFLSMPPLELMGRVKHFEKLWKNARTFGTNLRPLVIEDSSPPLSSWPSELDEFI